MRVVVSNVCDLAEVTDYAVCMWHEGGDIPVVHAAVIQGETWTAVAMMPVDEAPSVHGILQHVIDHASESDHTHWMEPVQDYETIHERLVQVWRGYMGDGLSVPSHLSVDVQVHQLVYPE